MTVKDFLAQWHDGNSYVVAHTSGSTGSPKEIRLQKSDMAASARDTCQFFGIGSDSTLLLPLSVDYVAGKMQVVRSILSGAHLVTVPPTRDFGAVDVDVPITMAPLVPAQIRGYLSSRLASVTENLIIGGAPMSADEERMLADSGIRSYATYGMTETSSHVALRRVGEQEYHAIPGHTFEQDAYGCLVVVNPHRTWQRLVTRDMAQLIDPVTFIYLGRADDVIITGGLKVHPQEVERLLCPVIGYEFYITSRPSRDWGSEVVLAITDNKPYDEERLLQAAATVLPDYRRPRAVVRVKPQYTQTGKLKRVKL